MSAEGLVSEAGERSEPRPEGPVDARAREPDMSHLRSALTVQRGREARPSEGPKGPSPRDCREADAPTGVTRGPSKEAEA